MSKKLSQRYYLTYDNYIFLTCDLFIFNKIMIVEYRDNRRGDRVVIEYKTKKLQPHKNIE